MQSGAKSGVHCSHVVTRIPNTRIRAAPLSSRALGVARLGSRDTAVLPSYSVGILYISLPSILMDVQEGVTWSALASQSLVVIATSAPIEHTRFGGRLFFIFTVIHIMRKCCLLSCESCVVEKGILILVQSPAS